MTPTPAGDTPDKPGTEANGQATPDNLHYIRPTPEQLELTALDPQQWHTKVPGDTDGIRTLATRLETIATNMNDQRTRLGRVDVSSFWSGDSATAFSNYKQQLPPRLDTAHKRYHLTGSALTKYNGQLTDAQDTAKRAARSATEAKDQIERAGHKVADWPTYCSQQPPTGHHPYPMAQQAAAPVQQTPDNIVVQPDATTPVRPEPIQPITDPPVKVAPPTVIAHPSPDNSLYAAYEEFYAALRLMATAIDLYSTAASACAASIHNASNDSMKDSSTFTSDFSTLKTAMLQDLGGHAPQLRDQISKLTGIAGMLGIISLVTMGSRSGTDTSGTASTLTSDADKWATGKVDGKQVVDDFLAELRGNTDKVTTGPVGTGDQQSTGDQTQLGTGQQSGDQTVQGTVPPTQTFTTKGPGGTYNVSIYIGAPAGGGTPAVTSSTLPVPATA